MTQYTADTWGLSSSRERRHPTSVMAGATLARNDVGRSVLPSATTPEPGNAHSRLHAAAAASHGQTHIYNLYRFKHFLKYINFLIYAI